MAENFNGLNWVCLILKKNEDFTKLYEVIWVFFFPLEGKNKATKIIGYLKLALRLI